MRILYLHSSNELYGADVVLLVLVRGTARDGIESFVILPCDVAYEGLLSRELEASGIPYREYDHAVLRRMYFTPLGVVRYATRLVRSTMWLRRLIRTEHVDLVHSNTSAVLAGALAAKVAGVPHVWHIHEIITNPRILWHLSTRLINELSDRVVAVSHPVADHLARAVPAIRSKMTVVHNGIDLERFRPGRDGAAVRRGWGIEPESILVGMVARVSQWKGQELFVEAAAKVATAHANARFAIIGGTFPGQEYLVESLRSRIEALGLNNRVVIAGFRTDIEDVWAALDVVVCPSLQPDPFPTSVLEAMATGKPVVASAHGGPTEMIVDGETGLLVPPRDPEALASAVSSLVGDHHRRVVMGRAARERVEENFSIERFVHDFEGIYAGLLPGRTRSENDQSGDLSL